MSKILYKTKNAVVIEKPAGMPSQSDPSGDTDAMTATSETLFSAGEDGRLWLVHRLDRTVGGVMAFARSSKAAASLSREIADGSFRKEYLAVIEGGVDDGEMRDYLFKDSSLSKAFVVKGERRGAKLAVLEAFTLETVECEGRTYSLLKIKLKTGRFHQIRAQLSGRGAPLVGDGKYGSREKRVRTPSLFASLIFSPTIGPSPIEALPDLDVFPWSLFKSESYQKEKTK